MTVLQTIALPLGYSAIRMARGRVITAILALCQHLDFVSRLRLLIGKVGPLRRTLRGKQLR